jgi:hypothetical protein
MVEYSLRFAKRFAVLVPGLVIAYFSVRNIFPYIDRQLPLAFAIFLTYVLVAYVLTPAAIRLYRVVRPPKHLPHYCITPDGFASDPLNIGLIGTREEVIAAMEKAGWHQADPHTLRNVIRSSLSIIYGWSYPKAPVSSLYLFGRHQDLAFEIPIGGSPAQRHHVRFWAASYNQDRPLDSTAIDWHNRGTHLEKERLLWVGAASLDTGVNYIRHNFQLTHTVDPDTNKERELIVRQLKAKGVAGKVETIKLGEPYKLINRVLNGSLHSDGTMSIVRLKLR